MSELISDIKSNLMVGVLALQGDFECHVHSLERVGVKAREVRSVEDFDGLDALILPGGESTTMALLLREFDMWESLKSFVKTKPTWGTCAGLILLSSAIEDGSGKADMIFEPLKVLDVTVTRNAYGRQIHSFEDDIEIIDGATRFVVPVSFIRAPKIVRVGSDVDVLSTTADTPTLVRQGNILGSAFHTELHDDTTFIRYFLNIVSSSMTNSEEQKLTDIELRSREVA